MAAPYVSGILALNIALRPDNDMQLHVDRLVFTSKKRSQLSGASRSRGIVSLASSLALDSIPHPPVIEGHSEQTLFVAAGDSVEMSVEVSSETPLTLEWRFNDTPLVGEISETLILDSVSEADEGSYTVTAQNEDGEDTVTFELNVLTHDPTLAEGLDVDPSVVVMPEYDDQWSLGFDPDSRDGDHIEGVYPTEGRSNNLRAIVRGPGLLRFLWKLEGAPDGISRPVCQVDGRNLRLYAAPGEWHLGVALLDEDKDYELVWQFNDTRRSDVENGRLIIDHLTVHPEDEAPPLIYKHPDDIEARPFDDVSLYAFVSGSDLTYDWYRDGELRFPNSQRDLSLRDVTTGDEGSYHLVVSNAHGSDTSRSAKLEVNENETPAHFNEWTKDIKSVKGERLDITLDHGGSPNIQYKWYRNQYELPGENGPVLSFNPLRMEHAGSYEMEIVNPYGPSQRSQNIGIQVVDRDLSPAAVLGHRDPYTIEVHEGDTIDYNYWIATEFLPLEFQWYRDGLPVEGQTNQDLRIVNATYEDSGVYFLEFKNDRGSFRGGQATVVVHFDAGDALDFSDVAWEINGQEDRGWKYSQREVSFDGEDAFEFARRYEFHGPTYWDDGGFSEFVGAYFTGPLNLSAYWKRTSEDSWFEAHVGEYPRFSLGEFPTADRVAIFKETDEVGEWQKSVIHVPAGEHFVTFRFVGAHPNEKGWLDKIEITEAPAVISEVPERFLVGAGGISVNAQVSGSGTVAYQWFKNGVALNGDTSPTLHIAGNAFESSDRFYMSATSEFGQTFSGSFQLASVEEIIDTRNRVFNFGGDSYWEQNTQEVRTNSLKITLKPEESAWTEFDVFGPAVVSYDGSGVTAFVDGSLTSPAEWIGPYELRNEYLNVPAGVHTVRLSYGSRPGDSSSRTNYIADLRISGAPLIINGDPTFTNGASDYRMNTAVYFAGALPVSIKWYKNGQLTQETSSNSSSPSRFFSDPDISRNPGHAGTYYCEITDANGVIRRSENFVVREVDTREIGDVIGDVGLYLCDTYTPVSYDTEVFVEGDSSAFTTILSGWSQAHVKLCGPDPSQEPYPAFELSVRLSGFDHETIVEVSDGDDRQLLDLTEEWQTVKLNGNSNILRIQAEKSLTSELSIWFDGVKRDYDLRVTEEPQHFATYLNGGASFSVEAFSEGQLSYQWRRDSVNILGATSNRFEIEKVSLDDLGQYTVLISSGVESITSKPAILSIANDLGAAIEYPGLRIRTWGDALWNVDESVSIDGTNSLRSGEIGPGESSHIEIEFDFPGMYSVYNNFEYTSEEKQRWEIRNDVVVDAPYKIDLTVSTKNGEANSDNYIRFIRLDRLSFSALASQSYEEWLDDAVFLASNPVLRDSLFDESADPDGDRISNFIEYLFDLDPLTSSRLPNLNIDVVNGRIVAGLSYRFAANGNSTVMFEVSEDLQNWNLLYPDNSLQIRDDGKYYDIHSTARVPLSEKGQTFVRWTTSKISESLTPIEINNQTKAPEH